MPPDETQTPPPQEAPTAPQVPSPEIAPPEISSPEAPSVAPEASPSPENIPPAQTLVSENAQITASEPPSNFIQNLLVRARSAIQTRKRKKLDTIMTLFAKRTKITNDEVEKFLHVSDASATRYLSMLEQEGKIKQAGRTGKYTFYTKI